MSNPIPEIISAFIKQHHVVSLACTDGNELWAASCFYTFDEVGQRLIILTDSRTKHGKMMLHYPNIAGTIAAQPILIKDIEGIQFKAVASCLEGEQQAAAFADYMAKHPMAKPMNSEVWALYFVEIKHTENRTAFAYKREWHK